MQSQEGREEAWEDNQSAREVLVEREMSEKLPLMVIDKFMLSRISLSQNPQGGKEFATVFGIFNPGLFCIGNKNRDHSRAALNWNLQYVLG
jgi:hypothetical protein